MISATCAESVSSGSAARFGMPPASETTSGRLATANSARISEAVIPAVRAAYRSRCGSRFWRPLCGLLGRFSVIDDSPGARWTRSLPRELMDPIECNRAPIQAP